MVPLHRVSDINYASDTEAAKIYHTVVLKEMLLFA